MPATTVCDEGVTVMLKSEITRLTETLCVLLPPAPVITRVELPAGVAADVVTVKVELPAPAMEPGLKLAVAPAGKPLTLRPMLELNPLMALEEMV